MSAAGVSHVSDELLNFSAEDPQPYCVPVHPDVRTLSCDSNAASSSREVTPVFAIAR